MLWRVRTFPDFCEPCLPSQIERPPAGNDWIHEIKHDGFRLLARRGAERVRLFTRNGNDWSQRFPLIVEALNAIKATTCLIDGEAVTCSEAPPHQRRAHVAMGCGPLGLGRTTTRNEIDATLERLNDVPAAVDDARSLRRARPTPAMR